MDKIISNYHTTALTDTQGQIQDFKLGGAGALKKFAPSRGRHEHFWGILCEKSYFSNFRGGEGVPGVHPPGYPTC